MTIKFEEAAEPDPARWASSQAEGGRFDGVVDLTRLADGRVMCQLCFGYFTVDQLWVDDHGRAWDVCVPCRAAEEYAERVRRRNECVTRRAEKDGEDEEDG